MNLRTLRNIGSETAASSKVTEDGSAFLSPTPSVKHVLSKQDAVTPCHMTARTNPQAPAGRKNYKNPTVGPFLCFAMEQSVHSSQLNRSSGHECAVVVVVVVVVVSTVSHKTGL